MIGPGGRVLAQYSWNLDGSILGKADALGNWIRYQHNSTSVQISAPASQNTVYTFNAGALVSIQSSGAEPQNFTWNPEGTLQSVSSGPVSSQFTYDTLGNIVQVIKTTGTTSLTQQFTYRTLTSSQPQPHVMTESKTVDPNGISAFLSKTTYGYSGSAPNLYQTTINRVGKGNVNNFSQTRTLDTSGRVTALTVNSKVVARYGYDTTTNLLAWSKDANDIQTNYAYDSWDRATDSATPDLKVSTKVTLDSQGRVVQALSPLGATTLTYDGASCRVLTVNDPTSSSIFAYDSQGRRTSQQRTVNSTGNVTNGYQAYSDDNATMTCGVNGQQTCSKTCMSNANSAQCPSGQFPCSCQAPGPNGMCCFDPSTNQCSPY
jgi:YD repeat-containing protein